MIATTYPEIRALIQPGDIFAFSGNGFISSGIKLFTHSPISHVGIVLETKLSIYDDPQPGRIIQLIESTTLNGRKGVQINRLSERLENYDGEVWWTPLSDDIRERCDWVRFYDYLLKQVGKAYDYNEVGGMTVRRLSKIPFIGRLFTNPRNSDKFYCSELACSALQRAGAIDQDVNYSEIAPQDLMQMKLYRGAYQVKGKSLEIPRFNTL